MLEQWVALMPLDTVAIRDGRPFTAGSDSYARAARPMPTTIAGALVDALGLDTRNVGKDEEVAGPFPVKVGPQPRLLLPAPADLWPTPEGDKLRRGKVTALNGVQWDLPLEAAVAPPDGHGEPITGWLMADTVADYLEGTTVLAGGTVDDGVFGASETHVGLWRRPDRTAQDGYLYATEHIRMRDESHWGYAARLRQHAPVTVTQPVIRFGGEARSAEVRLIEGLVLPAAPDDFPGGRLCLYLATPALLPDGWLPDLGAEVQVVTAATRGPLPQTGRSGGRLRTARLAVGAGSIYLLQAPSEMAARELADELHGNCLPNQVDPVLRTAGFGLCLCGRWM